MRGGKLLTFRSSNGYREEIYGTVPDGRTLKVVIVEGSQPITVVTVMPIQPGRFERIRGS